jgi:hypothetical protein
MGRLSVAGLDLPQIRFLSFAVTGFNWASIDVRTAIGTLGVG